MMVEFRRMGDTAWRADAPALRAYPTLSVDGAPLGLNYAVNRLDLPWSIRCRRFEGVLHIAVDEIVKEPMTFFWR